MMQSLNLIIVFRQDSAADTLDHSLPIILQDTCHTKGRYKDVIMTVTIITDNDKSLIIVFGVSPTESYE
jgi:hypothetical protein